MDFRCTNVYTGDSVAGDIGASTVEGRDRKIKLGFGRYMFKTRNGLLRAIFQRMCGEIRSERWMRQLREYMGELEISFNKLESMTKFGTEPCGG